MDKDEKYILSHLGKENHFKVPKGYFETFNERMMRDLQHAVPRPSAEMPPARPLATTIGMPRRSRLIALRRTIISAAAGICVAVLTLQGLLRHGGEHLSGNRAITEEVSSDASVSASMDALFDYTMTDADDMYAYMSNAR